MEMERIEVEVSKAAEGNAGTVSCSTSLEQGEKRAGPQDGTTGPDVLQTGPGVPAAELTAVAPLNGVAKMQARNEAVQATVDKFRQNPDNSYEEILKLIGEYAFDLMENDQAPPLETLADMVKLVITVQNYRLKVREAEFAEQKYRDQQEERLREEQASNQPKQPGGLSEEAQEVIRTTLRLM